MGTPDDTRATRAALIEAAGELFSTRGLSGVTARQVAARAQVALSAIPYHFGTMEALYREVLVVACERSMASRPLAEEVTALTPRAALEQAVRWSLDDYAQSEATWPVRLVEREMVDPSDAFRDVVKRRFGPEWDLLCAIIGRATRMPASEPAVQFGVVALYATTSTLLSHRRLLSDFAPAVLGAAGRSERFVTLLADLTLDAVRRYATTFARAGRSGSARRAAR